MSISTLVSATAKVAPATTADPTSAPPEVNAPPLPPPAATWTDATTAALAALADCFQKGREGMRESKKSLDKARQAAMQEEVRAMREQAKEIRNGALVQAATLAVSAHYGALSVTTCDAGLASKYKWAADSWGRSDAVVKGVFDARAREREADAAAARASAERAKTSGEDLQEMTDVEGELTSKAMDAIRSVLEARHAATLAVLSQRG